MWGHFAVSHRSFPLSTIYCTAGIQGLLCFRKRYPKSPLCPRLRCDVLDTTMLSLSRLGPLFGIKGSLSVLCSPHPLLPIKVIKVTVVIWMCLKIDGKNKRFHWFIIIFRAFNFHLMGVSFSDTGPHSLLSG